MRRISNQSGFSLAEMLVAMTIMHKNAKDYGLEDIAFTYTSDLLAVINRILLDAQSAEPNTAALDTAEPLAAYSPAVQSAAA